MFAVREAKTALIMDFGDKDVRVIWPFIKYVVVRAYIKRLVCGKNAKFIYMSL